MKRVLLTSLAAAGAAGRPMRRIVYAALMAAGISPAFADTNPDDYTCQFADLPPMRFQRHDPSNYTLRVGDALPVKLNVGSSYAIADVGGQELIFWEDGVSVRIADVFFKGTCK
ncbi:hypothetical protein EHS39_23470 [Ensifer sp. MPMI2T]|nr:hypothetical protein EHS39_23470 [Ensifer sp. MPMI2T]